MIVVRLLLLLFAAALSLVAATPAVPTFQHVSPRGPGRKIIGDIPPPNSPSIRDLINLFRRMLPARQNNAPPPRADLAEIRRRYMITPTRRYPNAVFYVNQPRTATMNDANPNWGTNRALQLRSIIEAQLRRGDPNAESWTLYQAYDCRTAFGIVTTDSDFPSDIRRAALSLNEERDWFRQTSAAFAEMVTETVFLVVEEGSNAIGSDSIWATHELPAIQAARQVNMIWEVRPANIGGVLDGTQPLTLIPYRDPNAIGSPTTTEPGGPVTSPATPPGSGIPPHDEFKRGDNPIDVKVDAKKALEARQFPEIDLSNTEDFTPTPEPAPKPPAPYKEGTCWIHLKQWKNPKSGGGSPFDNPNDAQ
ncbi:hypothetical protein DL96DRAFT_242767 [Flagelloscypha sp. PMI_526]|nr:hypothetical protein DL96DRAFT_242767 [Flagelloscypha sp. PMI_526]